MFYSPYRFYCFNNENCLKYSETQTVRNDVQRNSYRELEHESCCSLCCYRFQYYMGFASKLFKCGKIDGAVLVKWQGNLGHLQLNLHI